MAWQSNTSSDGINSTGTISVPAALITVSMFYKPAADPLASTTTARFGWMPNTFDEGVLLTWDSQFSNESWFFRETSSGLQNTSWQSSGYGGTWHSFIAEYDGANNNAYLDGALFNASSGAAQTAWTGSHIGIGAVTEIATASPGGTYSRVSVWGLSEPFQRNEILYLSLGGYPLSMRPRTQATELIEYLDLGSNALDTGPNTHAQTVTGSGTFVADPALLAPAASIFSASKLTGIFFAGAGINSTLPPYDEVYMCDALDANGTQWQSRPGYCVSSLAGSLPNLRQPEVTLITGSNTTHNGEIWMGATPMASANPETSHQIELFKLDANGYNFDSQVVLDVSSITGTGSGSAAWGEVFWVDPATQNVHLLLSLSSASPDVTLYEMHPTAADWTNPANWSAPVQILDSTSAAIHASDINIIDYTAGVYTAFISHNSLFVYVIQSSSLLTGWTYVKTGDWASWGSKEGVKLRKLSNGKYIAYLDNTGAGAYYSLSDTTSLTGTWSTPAAITINGLTAVSPNLIAVGFNTFQMPPAAAALAATPAAVVAVTAALTTGIKLAATPAAVVAVTAALTTGIKLAAAVAGAATITAALSTGIKLAAAAASVGAVTAALTTGIPLAAAPLGQATVTAALTSGIKLAAAPSAVATLTATLSSGSAFSAQASGVASLTAALTTGIRLAASPAGVSSVTANLLTAIRLSAALSSTVSLSAAFAITGAVYPTAFPVLCGEVIRYALSHQTSHFALAHEDSMSAPIRLGDMRTGDVDIRGVDFSIALADGDTVASVTSIVVTRRDLSDIGDGDLTVTPAGKVGPWITKGAGGDPVSAGKVVTWWQTSANAADYQITLTVMTTGGCTIVRDLYQMAALAVG